MNKCVKRLALGMALGGASMGAMAFSDGTLSPISTGAFDVRLILGMKARVWGLQDLSFTTANGGEKADGNLCVFSGSKRVSVKMSGSFSLNESPAPGAGPAGARMDFIVRLKGVGAGNGVIPSGGGNVGNPNTAVTWGNPGVTPDNASGATHSLSFVAQDTDSTNCSGTNENLNVEVEFATPSATFAPGTYTSYVELVVEPS